MANRFRFSLSDGFVSKDIVAGYQEYIEKMFGNTYNDVEDVINATVQGVTIPGINITHPKFRKFKRSSLYSSEILDKQIVISFRRIDGNINFYPLLEEVMRNYKKSGKKELFLGDCTLTYYNERSVDIFRITFRDCLMVKIEQPEVDYEDVGEVEQPFDVTLEWNEIKITPLPAFD